MRVFFNIAEKPSEYDPIFGTRFANELLPLRYGIGSPQQ